MRKMIYNIIRRKDMEKSKVYFTKDFKINFLVMNSDDLEK